MADPETPDSVFATTDAGEPSSRVVLMAYRAEESQTLADALREEELSVLSCDIIALPERVARVDPFAIIVDIEQPNAAPALARLLEMPNRKTVIAAVGTTESADRLNLRAAERARLFPHPLQVMDVLGFLRDIARLDGRGPRVPPSSSASAGTGTGVGLGSSAETSSGTGVGTGVGDSDALLLNDFPAMAGMPEVEGILPKLDGGPISTKVAGQLSPEIEELLEASAKRVRARMLEPSQPAAESNVIVPPDMLAQVGDLLASDDAPPATRGGMDFGDMQRGGAVPASGAHPPRTPGTARPAARAARGSDPLPPAAPSSNAAAFDSHPSWHTGVPEGAISDVGSVPTGLISEEGEKTGLGEDERPSDAPGTAIGLGEETSVPTGGTQVGHSSPLESGPLPGPAPDPPASGSSPPMPTELRSQSAGASQMPTQLRGPSEAPSYGPTGIPGGSSPPPRTEHYVAAHPGGPVRVGSEGPPDSALIAPSELAPMTTAGRPAFSSRHPQSRESAMPMNDMGQPPSAAEPIFDSHEVVRGDPFAMLAGAVRRRVTGALVLGTVDGKVARRILMRDGDMVNAASEHEADALVHFLVKRGDLSPEVAQMRSARLPHTGRHAAAALIANGFLGQDDLWPVLRSHAEWIIGQALAESPCLAHLEREPPERLRAEPNVFGGAAGVEVFIEAVRRALPAADALARLGGPEAVLGEGASMELLAESALTPDELDRVRGGLGQRVTQALDPHTSGSEAVLFALVTLGILSVRAPSRHPTSTGHPGIDPLDADAVRQRVRARMALVHEADYFSLLGVSSGATGYEIRRAFVELRRNFEPTRLLTAATSDLHDDVQVIVEVLEEAYQILRDPHRRTRYRRALEASIPS